MRGMKANLLVQFLARQLRIDDCDRSGLAVLLPNRIRSDAIDGLRDAE